MPYYPYDPYHVWDDLYDHTEHSYDPLLGYVRRPLYRSPIIVSTVPFGSPALASSAYQTYSAPPAGPVTITIPNGNPFTDGDHVIAAYHTESRKARGLEDGIGGCSIREDAEEIVKMMKQAADSNVRYALSQLGDEAQIQFVLKKFKVLGYKF